MTPYFFQTQQLTVGYNGKPLIKDINVNLEKGNILTLIGPNGAGKTTILRSISRHLKRIAGTVVLDKENVFKMKGRSFARRLAVVLTERVHTERMTCENIVEMGRYPYTGKFGVLSEPDRLAVYKAMEQVNILDLRDTDFMRISDGQKQRVMIARAICQEPDVLILDEPTSFLDIRYELELLDILRKMAKEKGITIIMSLHDLTLAQRLSDEVMCVKGDAIRHYGKVEDIFKQDLLSDLYEITEGSYSPLLGNIELRRPDGEPKCFVIAGGGTGIPTYRTLQRRQTAFSTGVLHPADVDYEVAKVLASQLVVAKAPFASITEAEKDEAKKLIDASQTVINCLVEYGDCNLANKELLEYAQKQQKRILNNANDLP